MSSKEPGCEISTDQYIQLMRDHDIHFEGRILPDEWREYSATFKDIRHIGNIRSPDSVTTYEANDNFLIDLEERASNLIKGAWSSYSSRDTEMGWRERVEYPAFQSFETEIICLGCNKRRWKPIFEAKPLNTDEAERLERSRRRRKICSCDRVQRAEIRRDDHQSRIFNRQLDKRAEHEDVEDDIKPKLKRRRPDRVIGLGATATFRQLQPRIESRYSPFGTLDMLYPFLVIEAKQAETSGASFGSILRQTAFVLRTCLRLQQNLIRETNGNHQCLVWSFANIGEEWRLYAAVPHGNGVRIFDLWHGTVLFHEGAYQLILLIEYICDWACEIFRTSILNCLLDGKANQRMMRLSPTGTEFSSQASEAGFENLRESPFPFQRTPSQELTEDPMPAYLFDKSDNLFEIGALLSTGLASTMNTEDTYNWRRWIAPESDPQPWTKRATIRHSNQVEFVSLRLILPDEAPTLHACLKVCFPGLAVDKAAKKLLAALTDVNSTILTNFSLESRSGTQWSKPFSPCRVMVYFNSAIRRKDWQIVRQQLVIVCSENSAALLAMIASVNARDVNWYDGQKLSTGEIVEATSRLHFLDGVQSAGLAISRFSLCLKALPNQTGQNSYRWIRSSAGTANALSTEDLVLLTDCLIAESDAARPSFPVPHLQKECLSYITLGSSRTGEDFSRILDLPRFSTTGILVKKPRHGWPDEVQEFCFFIMDEKVDFDDEKQIAGILDTAISEREVWGPTKERARYTTQDKTFATQWIRLLQHASSASGALTGSSMG